MKSEGDTHNQETEKFTREILRNYLHPVASRYTRKILKVIALWDKRWPTDLAVASSSPLEAKSSQP